MATTTQLMFSSCSGDSKDKSQKCWISTQDGHKFWGTITDEEALYTWEGDSIGLLINGKGKLTVYADDGDYTDEQSINAYFGSLSEKDWKNCPKGKFLGKLEDNKPSGFGVMQQDSLSIVADFEKGVISSCNVEIYKGTTPIYIGHMEDGKYDGVGRLYENGHIKYVGNFANGKFDGKGVLYENGIAKRGNWSNGMYEASLLKRTAVQIKSQVNSILGNKNSNEEEDQNLINYSSLDIETFIVDTLYTTLNNLVSERVQESVDDRYGLMNLPRMLWQKCWSANGDRKQYAEEYFIDELNCDEIKDVLNEKIRWYNETSNHNKIKEIENFNIEGESIVTDALYDKIQKRETMEISDILLDRLLDFLGIPIFACIIGFIVGIFVGSIGGSVDDALAKNIGCFAFFIGGFVGIYLNYNAIYIPMIELENEISQMLTTNIMNAFSCQGVLTNLLP